MSRLLRAPTTSDQDYFQIGDVVLAVSPANIETSRNENYQIVSYLRDIHSMRVSTGRATIRFDISFQILNDTLLPHLQALVAMTRVTPFVPVANKYLQSQILKILNL